MKPHDAIRRQRQRAAAADHPLADLPVSQRIDVTLAVLSARGLTPAEGWSLSELAELCGCSDTSIHIIELQARAKLRRLLRTTGVDAADLT